MVGAGVDRLDTADDASSEPPTAVKRSRRPSRAPIDPSSHETEALQATSMFVVDLWCASMLRKAAGA